MKNKIYPALILILICTVVAALLVTVNHFTAPEIERVEEQKIQDNLNRVYPGGENFKELNLESLPKDISDTIVAVYTEDGGGYVFQMETQGYKSGLVIMCGISPDGKIVGAKCVLSNETNKAENFLGDRFVGKDNATFAPEIVSGSTKTTNAYSKAIKDALDAFDEINVKVKEEVSDEEQ